MSKYEYKVVPAPAKGRKARGVRKAEDKFAFALEDTMNELAQDGWEFQRTETLPNEERSGLTSSTTTYRSVMVFRRSFEAAQNPQPVAPVVQTVVETLPEPEPQKKLPAPQTAESEPDDSFFENADLIPPAKSANHLPAALRQRAGIKPVKTDIAAE